MNRLSRNILLIPGPLTTSRLVKKIAPLDYSAREDILINKIRNIRSNLLKISGLDKKGWTSVLFQGSGTMANEAVISSLPQKSQIDVFSNGIYGDRLAEISNRYDMLNKFSKIDHRAKITGEIVERNIKNSHSTHIALIHHETTTGILNDLESICDVAKKYNKKIILDAISSFGGVPIDIQKLDIDYLVGSSNKCLHGYPGLGFVIVKRDSLEENKGCGRTLTLDLYDQYIDLHQKEQFRYTPPVQVISALDTSLTELVEEGGVEARHDGYKVLNDIVYDELIVDGFSPYIRKFNCSPICSTYTIPNHIKDFNFGTFAKELRDHNIVLYPSPIPNDRVIRIGNIGDITTNELYESLFIMKKLINQSKYVYKLK